MALWDADPRTQRIVAGAAVAVAVLTLGFAGYRFFFPPPRSESIPHEAMAYFYDLNTGDTFTAPATERGPLETESGPCEGHPAGVRAHVYACQSCDDPQRRFVAWVEIPIEILAAADAEKYHPYLERDNTEGEIASTMVRRPDDAQWVPADSLQALQIFEQIDGACAPGEDIFRCRPPARPID